MHANGIAIGAAVIIGGCMHGLSVPEPTARQHRVWAASLDTPAELTHWSIQFSAADAASIRHAAEPGARGIEVRIQKADGSVELRQQISAVSLRGERIRLSARLRAPKAFARAVLQVGRPATGGGVASLAESREVASAVWTDVYAVVDIARDATYLEIRLKVQGEGEAWFDEVAVERLARPSPSSIAASSLSAEDRRSLAVLGQVLPRVRYFHPSDESVSADWDSFSIHAVERVLASHDRPLHEVINEVLASIAPLTQLYPEGSRPIDQPSPRPGEPRTSPRSSFPGGSRSGSPECA